MAVDLEKVKAFLGQEIDPTDVLENEVLLQEALDHVEALVAEVEGLRAAAEAKEKAFQRLSGQYARLLGQLADDVGGTR